jgi:iron complex transport system permease protein
MFKKVIVFLFILIFLSLLFFRIGTHGQWQEMFSYRLNIYIQSIAVVVVLSFGGKILQTMLLNPLAEPYILGVSSAASLGAVIAVFFSFTPLFLFRTLFSLGAAALVSFLVYLFSKKHNSFSIGTALLAGVGFNALFSSWIMLMQSLLRPNDLQSSIFWLMGNIEFKGIYEIILLVIAALGIVIYYIYKHKELDIYLSGEEVALASGVDTARLKKQSFILVSITTAVVVSLTGMIGFVGLVVPHIVRMLFGEGHRKATLPLIFAGSGLMIGAMILSRHLIPGSILPIGMITSLIGAPFFIVLLVSMYRGSR